jgi:hypothetical protein
LDNPKGESTPEQAICGLPKRLQRKCHREGTQYRRNFLASEQIGDNSGTRKTYHRKHYSQQHLESKDEPYIFLRETLALDDSVTETKVGQQIAETNEKHGNSYQAKRLGPEQSRQNNPDSERR